MDERIPAALEPSSRESEAHVVTKPATEMIIINVVEYYKFGSNSALKHPLAEYSVAS